MSTGIWYNLTDDAQAGTVIGATTTLLRIQITAANIGQSIRCVMASGSCSVYSDDVLIIPTLTATVQTVGDLPATGETNDVIKVEVDASHDNVATYYKWTTSWGYIGKATEKSDESYSLIMREFSSLENNKEYFIRVVAESKSGISVTTDDLWITVLYTEPVIYQIFNAENKPLEGCVNLSAKINYVAGKADPSPATFIDNKIVDVRYGKKVYYDEDYETDGNFVLAFEVLGLNTAFINQSLFQWKIPTNIYKSFTQELIEINAYANVYYREATFDDHTYGFFELLIDSYVDEYGI